MIRYIAICFCIAFGVFAQEKSPITQHNFLFIVDTSVSMTARKPIAVQMMRELIQSSFLGQIRPGDSIDIWTYDESNHISGFPPQIWEDAEALRIATRAARYIETMPFKGRSRFAPVGVDLELLLPSTKRLLVVILTDGDEPISGISLDLALNEQIARMKRARPNPKQPFLISLAAVNGKFAEWTIYDGDGKNDLARLPERPRPAPLVAEVKPKKKEPEKKTEPEKPIVLDLPPGARVTTPTPPPVKQQAIAAPSGPVQTPETHKRPEVAANTVTPSVQHPQNITSNAVTVASAPAGAPPAKPISNVLSSSTPKTTAQPPVQTARTEAPRSFATNAAAASSSATIASKVPQASPPQSKGTKSKPVEVAPSGGFSLGAVPPVAIFAGVAGAGLSIIALGGFLFIRRAKARQAGSIISRSLQR